MKCKKCGRDFKINEHGIECPFCFSVYSFTKDELDKLYFGALAAVSVAAAAKKQNYPAANPFYVLEAFKKPFEGIGGVSVIYKYRKF